jgi:hypothetical protein
MCRARDGEANRGCESGGNAAERRDDAAARQGSSGEVARVTGCTESTTNGTSATLASWRSSGAAPRRREDDDGAERLWRRGLGLRAAAAHGARAARARVGGSRGGGRLIKAWGPGLGVRATRRRRALVGLRRRRRSLGRGRHEVGDDPSAPLVSDSRRGRRRHGLAATAGPAGPWVLRSWVAGVHKLAGWHGRRRTLGWPAGPANLHGLERVLRTWAVGLEGEG